MLGSKTVWGIDVGRSSLKAVKIERSKNRLEVVDLDLVEFEQKDSEEVDREEQVREALKHLRARKKIKPGEPIFISIPGHGAFNRTVSLPPVDPKQIPDMVRYEAQQQIPFPIDDVIWGYQPVTNGKEFGEIQINLFAVKKEIVNNFLANVQATDMEVAGIQIAPLALYNFVVYDQSPVGAWVVIDMGAEYSDLVILHGSRIWIRNLQIAGNDITRAVQNKFQIPFGEAEKLKLKAGKSKHAQKIFAVMKPILKDLVGEIHRSIGYYKSQNADIRFDKILLMGNGTKLVGFKRFFKDNLPEYNIEVLEGLQRVAVSNRVNVNLLTQNLASFGIALGLAIQAAGEASNNVVLLPEQIRQEREFKKKKPLFVAGLIFLALAFVFHWFTSSNLLGLLKEQDQKAAEVIKKVQDLEEQYKAASEMGGLKQDLEKVAQVHPYRQMWQEVLNHILQSFPAVNDRTKNAELAKDRDLVWAYRIELYREDELDKTPPPLARPGGPPPPRPRMLHQLKARIGVMIVSRGSPSEDQRHVDTVVVAVLKDKLGKLCPDPARLSVKTEVKYRYMNEPRDPQNIFNPQGGAPPDKGDYFLRVLEVVFPLNGPPPQPAKPK